jgi:hypothetical protein
MASAMIEHAELPLHRKRTLQTLSARFFSLGTWRPSLHDGCVSRIIGWMTGHSRIPTALQAGSYFVIFAIQQHALLISGHAPVLTPPE